MLLRRSVYIKHIHTQNQTRKFEEKNPVTDFCYGKLYSYSTFFEYNYKAEGSHNMACLINVLNWVTCGIIISRYIAVLHPLTKNM